jgi:thioredoxin reductase (NADPH)
MTHAIDNYPGFPDGVDGPTLVERMSAQARRFGAEISTEEVTQIERDGDIKVVTTVERVCRAPTLILAMGADPRKLNVPGEKELRGRGVSYCGTCDAPFFRDKRVVVVGGGDTALKEALFLTKFTRETIIVHRRSEFRAEKIYQTEIRRNSKISLLLECVVTKIAGTERVEGVDVRNERTGEARALPCEGVFIFIGTVPNTHFLCNLFPSDCGGHVETDIHMMTSVPGVFAIGDVRKNSYRQIATAVGEGATAAIAAEHWLSARRAAGKA